ncbi:hypothetical protein ABPG77_007416 [Micractinium sp. CCAP 211/92]
MAAKMGMKLASGLGGSTRALAVRRTTAAARGRHTSVVAEARNELPVPVAAAGLSLVGAAAPAAAQAADGPSVDTAVASVVDIVKATGEVVKQGVSAAQTGAEYAKAAYEQVAPVVKSAVDVAAPVVEKGVKTAVDVATPVVQTGLQQAKEALTASGVPAVDPSAVAPVVKSTEQAVTTAKPFVEQAINFVTTTEPLLLGEYALGLVAAWYLAPPLLKLAAGAVRGYAGEVTPAAALTAVESDGSAVIVDIRSLREKEAGGAPDLPNASRLIDLEYAAIEDRKVRNQLRNAGELEVKVTALQIAALKRLTSGSTILLMDRSGSGTAKAVAKALAARGFGRVYIIKGGFQGWVASKLRVKAASVVSRVEVLPPGTFGTGSTRGAGVRSPSPRPTNGKVLAPTTVSSRRALPSSTGN